MIEEKELLNENSIPNLTNSKSDLNNENNNNLDNSANKALILCRLKINIAIILILHFLFKILDKFEYIWENEETCQNKDPTWKFHERVAVDPDYLCKSKNTVHFCYKNILNDYNINNGVICTMRNFILDPSKWEKDNATYIDQNDYRYKNVPLISNGFFNIKCETEKKISDYNKIYDYYFNAWNYTLVSNYNIINEEKFTELAKEKIVFFISRNYDSQNVFYSFLGFLNVFSLMKTYILNPEDIRVVFLESIEIDNDPFYDFYKGLVSRGGEPVHISKLNQKYNISSAIHIPLNFDSPDYNSPEIPKCKMQTKTFELLNKSIRQYMKIGFLTYIPNYNRNLLYYPKNLDENNITKYNKFVTIEWNKETPKDKNGKNSLLGNGPALLEALSKILPENILVRLADTSLLDMRGKIAIMKKTDFFITGSDGLYLSIFLPTNAIVQEITNKNNKNKMFQLMSNLSGHVTYSNIIKANARMVDNDEVLFYDVNNFIKVILAHMKKNNFIN